MGSFNTSCFASRQTIAPADTCYITFLAQNCTFRPATLQHKNQTSQLYGITSSTCYPTRFWQPLCPFLECTYADSGQLSLINTPSNLQLLPLFLSCALSSTPSVLPGENPHHESAFSLHDFLQKSAPLLYNQLRDPTSPQNPATQHSLFSEMQAAFDYIVSRTHQQRTFWAPLYGPPRPLHIAVLHNAAYTTLLNPTHPHPHSNPRSFFEHALAASMPPKNSTQRMARYLLGNSWREQLHTLNAGNPLPLVGTDSLHENLSNFLDNKITTDQLFLNLKPWIETYFLNNSLLQMNLAYEPMVYAPQDYSNEIGSRYSHFVSIVSAAIAQQPS